MSDYFYSLHMIVTGRGRADYSTWSAMDALAAAIADEEAPIQDYFKPLLTIMQKAKP